MSNFIPHRLDSSPISREILESLGFSRDVTVFSLHGDDCFITIHPLVRLITVKLPRITPYQIGYRKASDMTTQQVRMLMWLCGMPDPLTEGDHGTV